MKCLAACLLLVALSASSASAQQPATAAPSARRDNIGSTSEVMPTPAMWFYQQERQRYEDPQAAVRRNAEYDQAQRQARLASRRWLGYSNLRPTVDPLPMMGDYSAGWTSGAYMPMQWPGQGPSTIVVMPSGGYWR